MDDRVLDMKDREEVLLQIGNLSRKPSALIRAIGTSLPIPIPFETKITTVRKHAQKIIPELLHPFGDLIIGGQKRIPHRFASCCNPNPGNPVVGYITKLGVTIHRVKCASVRK